MNTRNRSRYPKARDKWSLLWFIPSNVLNMREETTNVKGQVIKKGERVGFETFNQLSCKDCRTVFHKTLSFAFHCSEENHGHLVNPFSTRSNVHIRTGLTKKLRVQNEEELENILDLGPRQVKMSLPESTAAAKRLKKYSLVVRTVPEENFSITNPYRCNISRYYSSYNCCHGAGEEVVARRQWLGGGHHAVQGE